MPIHKPTNHGTLDEIYAYVSIDENGKTGICATRTIMGMMPLVGATRKDMLRWKDAADTIRRLSGADIKLVRFTNGVIIEE